MVYIGGSSVLAAGAFRDARHGGGCSSSRRAAVCPLRNRGGFCAAIGSGISVLAPPLNRRPPHSWRAFLPAIVPKTGESRMTIPGRRPWNAGAASTPDRTVWRDPGVALAGVVRRLEAGP